MHIQSAKEESLASFLSFLFSLLCSANFPCVLEGREESEKIRYTEEREGSETME